MPSLSLLRSKEVDELAAELEKERAAWKTIAEEKAALENEHLRLALAFTVPFSFLIPFILGGNTRLLVIMTLHSLEKANISKTMMF